MADVPKGGYSYDKPTNPEAAVHLRDFDRAYSSMLDHLQAAWSKTGQAGLYLAIEQMFELQGSARALMQITMPKSSKTYGPHFRYLSR
jgi:hypothetical protein